MQPFKTSSPKSSRRGFVTGSVTIGAAAAAVTALPSHVEPAPATVETHLPKPERGGGYSLSEHVKRYYKTTRV